MPLTSSFRTSYLIGKHVEKKSVFEDSSEKLQDKGLIQSHKINGLSKDRNADVVFPAVFLTHELRI